MEPKAEKPRYKILVVDDHEDNVELLRARLQARGYEVFGANDGFTALEIVQRVIPDLILLDVMMPKMDGMEVVRRLKANRSLPFIPVIMQTALDSTENKVEGLDAGADDYITKPINFAELEAHVKSMLRIKQLQTELNQANEKLRTISLTDGLTGIENRRSLEERLKEVWSHSVRLHEPIALVMCDIDKFKSVNDTYGHLVGDEVLKEFARILKDEAREIDRVGRYGGEEFLLILPGTVLDAAVTFAERLREKVENHTFAYEGGTLRRTMSCGVAGSPHPRVKDQEALVRAADDALYVAKETGRNKVIRFDGTEFNEHTDSKGNDPKDAEKQAKEAGGGVPGSPPRPTATAGSQPATT
ncbi:MAG TPA: PleD family two-component system response regulator [Gemmatimonadaceae bacterium]|jgi:diguanylate cyclase (GGDEF)-like protein|nr:PleD family two-component system response regulator [Gemmatimonadaceae bacterium]